MYIIISLAFQGKSQWLGAYSDSNLVLSATTSPSHPQITIVFIYIAGRGAEQVVGFIGNSQQSLIDLMKKVANDAIQEKHLLPMEEWQKTKAELKAAMTGKYFGNCKSADVRIIIQNYLLRQHISNNLAAYTIL